MNIQTTNLKVEGMTCNHCVNTIKTSVGAIDGVQKVDVDLAGKSVTVEYDPETVDVKDIKDTIEDQGYDVVQ